MSISESQVMVRLSKELKKRLQQLANKDYRTLSNYIRMVLEEHAQKRRK